MEVMLDQLRTVDKTRLVKKLGQINTKARQATLAILGEMLAE